MQPIRKEFEKVVKRQKLLNKKTNSTLDTLLQDLATAKQQLQAGNTLIHSLHSFFILFFLFLFFELNFFGLNFFEFFFCPFTDPLQAKKTLTDLTEKTKEAKNVLSTEQKDSYGQISKLGKTLDKVPDSFFYFLLPSSFSFFFFVFAPSKPFVELVVLFEHRASKWRRASLERPRRLIQTKDCSMKSLQTISIARESSLLGKRLQM